MARFRRPVLMALAALFAMAFAIFPAPASAQTCASAATQGTAPAGWQSYCWLNFASYNDSTARSSSGQNLSFTLTDGSVLRFNLRVTGGSGTAYEAVTAPSWTGAAVGNTAFLGIPGRPVLYTAAAGTRLITITGITITPPAGAPAATVYSFVVADAESSNESESLSLTTNGGSWQLLDQVPPSSGSAYPAISGVGTNSATITGASGTVGAHILGSTSPTSISVQTVAGGLQGVMIAVRFASVRLTKQITGARISATDQFAFRITPTGGGSALASGTTSGSGTGPFTAASVNVASGLSLTLSESMASGSASALSDYHSTLTCTNGSSGSSTPLPVNLATTSHTLPSLQFGDALVCTFTNAAYPHVRVRKALGSGGRRFTGDQFIVRVRDGDTVLGSATTSGSNSTVNGGDTGMVRLVPGTAYTVDEVGAGATELARYTSSMACTNAASGSTTVLPAGAPGAITPQLGDVITCVITNTRRNGAALIISKSSTVISDPVNGAINPKLIPGAEVEYVITVTNVGNGTTNNGTVVITDALPPSMSFDGTTPVSFSNGSTASGLTFTNPVSRVSYSSQTSGGGPWTYSPAGGVDPNVRGLRFTPGGSMASASNASALPSFTVRFRARVN